MLKNLQNESMSDRIIRIIVGIVLAVVSYFYLGGLTQALGYLVAAILLATGISGICLIYKALGFRTNSSI